MMRNQGGRVVTADQPAVAFRSEASKSSAKSAADTRYMVPDSRQSSKSAKSAASLQSARSLKSTKSAASLQSAQSSSAMSAADTRYMLHDFAKSLKAAKSVASFQSAKSAKSAASLQSARSLKSKKSAASLQSAHSAKSLKSVKSAVSIQSAKSALKSVASLVSSHVNEKEEEPEEDDNDAGSTEEVESASRGANPWKMLGAMTHLSRGLGPDAPASRPEKGIWRYRVVSLRGIALRSECTFASEAKIGTGPQNGEVVTVTERVRIGDTTFLKVGDRGWIFDQVKGHTLVEGPLSGHAFVEAQEDTEEEQQIDYDPLLRARVEAAERAVEELNGGTGNRLRIPFKASSEAESYFNSDSTWSGLSDKLQSMEAVVQGVQWGDLEKPVQKTFGVDGAPKPRDTLVELLMYQVERLAQNFVELGAGVFYWSSGQSLSMRRHMVSMILENIKPCMDFHPGLQNFVMDLEAERSRLEDHEFGKHASPLASPKHQRSPLSDHLARINSPSAASASPKNVRTPAGENPGLLSPVPREYERVREDRWSPEQLGAGIGILPGGNSSPARVASSGRWGNPWQPEDHDGRPPQLLTACPRCGLRLGRSDGVTWLLAAPNRG